MSDTAFEAYKQKEGNCTNGEPHPERMASLDWQMLRRAFDAGAAAQAARIRELEGQLQASRDEQGRLITDLESLSILRGQEKERAESAEQRLERVEKDAVIVPKRVALALYQGEKEGSADYAAARLDFGRLVRNAFCADGDYECIASLQTKALS